MALTITPNFVDQVNSVLILAEDSNPGIAVRVASLASGTLGSLVASGAASVSWNVVGAPAWIVSQISTDTLTCTLLFNSAAPQTNPYQFYVVCTIGTQTVYFPILLEVREPFFVATPSGSTVLNIISYDSTVADIILNGYGLNDNQLSSGVRFIQDNDVSPFSPITPNLPLGLSLATQSEGGALLRVDQPNVTPFDGSTPDLSGGMKDPGVSQLTLLAYRPGSFYDTPQRAYTANFTVQSLSSKVGNLDFALAAWYDVANNWIRVDALADILQGILPNMPLSFNWSVAPSSTATATLTPHAETIGGVPASWVACSVTGAGNLSIICTIKDSLSNTIGTQTVGPIAVAIGATDGAWVTADAIQIGALLGGNDYALASSGQTVIFQVTVDTQLGETITLDYSVIAGGASETPISDTGSTTITYPATTANIPVTLPASTQLHQKWMLQISAANSGGSPPPTRVGYAQAVVESTGNPTISVVLAGGNSILSNTGASIAPIALSPTLVGSPAVPVTFRLVGAPDGVLIQNNQLVGNALQPGTYTFWVTAEATGYQRSFSSPVVLTVTAVAVPLSIVDPTLSVNPVADNSPFNIIWGFSGTPIAVTMQQNFTARDVTGATQTTTTEVGSSVISIYGSSFYGNAYSVPTFELSTAAAAIAQLQGAPTVGIIDENFNFTLNWQPVLYNNDQTYAIYKAWDIYLELNGGPPELQTLSTGLPTGLEPAGSSLTNRLFEEVLQSGDYAVNMTALSTNQSIALNSNPWASFLHFPSPLTLAQVVLSLQTAELGQSVQITLDPAYTGADQWRVLYGDNTTTGWLPLSINSVAKTFSISGNMSVVVQTARDYSTDNPPVRLLRQVTQSVFVSDVQFQAPGASSSSVTSTEGFGGPSGFEITNATASGVTVTPQAYEVLVRAIVKDTVTSELKLLVATSRFDNASSLLGTMALDVFALPGRPHAKDLIDLPLDLSVQSNTPAVPVSITTLQTSVPQIIVGKPMAQFALTATGGTPTYTWFSDNLPFGLKFTTDGTLSGTLLQLGTFAINFSVSDQSNPQFIAEKTLNLIAVSDLAITTTSLPAAQVGTPYNFVMANSGGLPPFTWAIVGGTLPIGLTIDPNSGTISGIPSTYNSTSDFSKTYSATIQVTDSIGAKVSVVVSMTLIPATLTLGALDQPVIATSEQFKLAAPVYGGRSPYSLAGFTELPTDIVIGNGLAIVNPVVMDVVAGIAPPTLTITTSTTQEFFPQVYPYNIEFPLAATGGVAPYTFYVDPSGNTTLPGAIVYGNILVGVPTADGSYQVAVKVIDSVGHVASATIAVQMQRQSPSGSYVATYAVWPVTVDFNGAQSNPGSWLISGQAASTLTLSQAQAVLPAGLPDAANGVAYAPSAGKYYGLALFKSGSLYYNQTAVSFQEILGTLPTGMVAINGNTAAGGSSPDASGIVIFNVTGHGGSNPSVNGSSPFEHEFTTLGGAPLAVAREVITVTALGGGTTVFPVVTSNNSLSLDLNTATGTPYGWYYPLEAEEFIENGAQPASFQFTITGATLPGANLVPFGNGVAIVSNTTQTGTFNVTVKATDGNGYFATATIVITLTTTVVQPIHILTSNLPASFYAGRPIPSNTYFIESDLIANWSASNLPAGISITAAPTNIAYLSGTPTTPGSGNVTFTATSTVYGSTASQTLPLQIKARTAAITTVPSSAIINTAYRVVTNNPIIVVSYVGYQPTDPDLPTLSASLAGVVSVAGGVGVGSPSVPGSTGILNLTSDGFQMQYDYQSNATGAEILTLSFAGSPPASFGTASFNVVYPPLVAVGQNVSLSVSHSAGTALFNPPVSISGGNPSYSILLTGVSDSRFGTFINNGTAGAQIQITVSQFTPGGTYSCIVSMTVTDHSTPTNQSVTLTGTLSITITP